MLFDLPLDQLRVYRPGRVEPQDFDAFWKRTLDETRRIPLAPKFVPLESGLKTVDVFDVSFQGYAGHSIKGWLLAPARREGRLPCVVEYIGYGGGRGFPIDWLTWSSCGYAHFVMDTRGQGSVWQKGDTPDPEEAGGNPQVPGFMTRGVLSPETYYYRRVFADAVRAVETARMFPSVDPDRVVLTGGSQGGGIALAVSGLDERVMAVMPDVPFLCHYRTATEITDRDPYGEIVQFCKIHRDKVEQVFGTLAYFDGINFAARAQCRGLFSVGLMDDICPPRTVFAAYNHFGGEKEIRVWPYNRHEGGQSAQVMEKVQWMGAL